MHGQKGNAYNMLGGKPEGRDCLAYNGCEDVDCTYLAPGKNQVQAFVKMVMDLQVS